MNSLFTSVLEISWQAGLIALAVMAVRPLLRRAPRRAVCMLWLLVALRLLLPARLTVESPVSLQQPESPPIQAYQELRQQEKVYVSAPPEQRLEMAGPAAAQGFALLDQLPAIWLTGVGCMALYMALSLLRMRWRLRAAPRIQDNVYRCTDWSTPFVLGVLAPRIYVPETVSEQDFPQVLALERCHIRRWDHVWKPLAFLLLAVNWFNPVLWAAYVLLGRDMERACDELALKNADAAGRAAYTRALVSCAARPRTAAVCPLAFGEIAVKERVKSVLHYKKPALWAAVLLVIAAAVIAVCLLTKPQSRTEADGGTAVDELPSFGEITPWPTLMGENDPHSVSAEDYGITYTADNMPDWYTWDTVPLSYLCAYYLNADGAYAEAAMDVLARRYRQAPDTVAAYIKSLSGQQAPDGRGDASEVLLADISAWDLGDTAIVDGSKLGQQVTQVVQGLSVQISGIHSYTEEKVVYDENSSGSVIVYTVYPGATLDVMVAPTYDDSEGRTHGEYKLYMKNGDTIELFPQTGPFDLTNALGVCAEGAYLIRFVPYGGDYLTFNENGAGMVSVPAVKFTGSGYTMYILDDGGWERVTIPGLDGTPRVSGKNAEIWQSTYDTSARLSVVHLNAMTFRQAQEWAVGAAGKSFTLTESKQGDMSGMNTAQTMYWTCAFYGTDDDRFAVIKTYPLKLTERLGYALNAMADTFTPLAAQPKGLTTTDTARLEVVRVTWETGETRTQDIPLTDAQVQTILSEKGTVQPEWHQVCATLHRSGEDDVRYWGTADYPVPPTVLKLLTEQGGYEFVTPEDFRGNMTSAKLEFYGGETYTAAQADLPALQKMLTNARPFGGASACWFTAKLTVTFDDGRTVSVLKATDSCASFMFGSWNNAMVSDRENDQFWQIFGVTLEE